MNTIFDDIRRKARDNAKEWYFDQVESLTKDIYDAEDPPTYYIKELTKLRKEYEDKIELYTVMMIKEYFEYRENLYNNK
jgi:hypothetical protein